MAKTRRKRIARGPMALRHLALSRKTAYAIEASKPKSISAVTLSRLFAALPT